MQNKHNLGPRTKSIIYKIYKRIKKCKLAKDHRLEISKTIQIVVILNVVLRHDKCIFRLELKEKKT